MRSLKLAVMLVSLTFARTLLPADAPAPAAKKDVSTNPSITGKITFEGAIPKRKKVNVNVPACAAMHKDGQIEDESLIVSESGAVKDVVVYVSKGAPKMEKVPSPAIVNQKACRYDPHVITMVPGQELHVGNSDDMLHNVHGIAEDNPSFNVGQNGVTPPKKLATAKAAEQFLIKCDVHPWMSCRVYVLETTFAAITDADGNFAIADLPPGKYTITTAHQKLGEATAEVTVEAGKAATANFKLKIAEE